MKLAAYGVALGGVLASLAVVVMALGGLIPVATFVCPMLSMLMLSVVMKQNGNRYAWAWYGAVAILGVLLGPDKEAAAIFVFLGYYPIVKPKLDRLPFRWLWKGILFNSSILLMYWLLMNLFGMTQLAEEFGEMGIILTILTLALGNVTFILLDRMLEKTAKLPIFKSLKNRM